VFVFHPPKLCPLLDSPLLSGSVMAVPESAIVGVGAVPDVAPLASNVTVYTRMKLAVSVLFPSIIIVTGFVVPFAASDHPVNL
jgi:hypothetical protein